MATAHAVPDFGNQLEFQKDDIEEFARIGRTGRRNAIADVNNDPNLHTSPNILADMMRNVNCENRDNKKPLSNK